MKPQDIQQKLMRFAEDADRHPPIWRNMFGPGLSTRTKNDGRIILNSREAEQKLALLKNELVKDHGGKIGQDEIGRRVEAALWKVIYPAKHQHNENPTRTRNDRALDAAEDILKPPQRRTHWTVWAEVGGMEEGQSAQFGGIWFGEFDDQERKRMLQSMNPSRFSTEQQEGLEYACMTPGREGKKREMQIARVTVRAYNAEAATEKGKRRIEETARILSIFRNTEDGHSSWIWTEQEGDNRTDRLVHTSNEEGAFLREPFTNHNMHGFRLKSLMQGGDGPLYQYRETARAISGILQKEKKTRAESQTVEGLSGIGTGQTQKDAGMTVLWTVVGIEYLACGAERQDRQIRTIDYVRSRIREKNICRIMTKLYRVRNKMVHEGKRKVSEEVATLARAVGTEVAIQHMRQKEQ